MDDDLRALRELGERLAPPATPESLRRRVLAGTRAATAAPRRWWRMPAAGLAAAAAVAVTVAVPVALRDRTPTPTGVLEQAAQRVAVTAPAAPGQFVYTESVLVYRTPAAPAGESFLVREWRSVDGTADGLVRETPSGRTDWRERVIPGCRDGRQATAVPDWFVPCGPVAGLPADPDGMLRHLRGADGHVLEAAARALYVGQQSPAVQKAVFDAVMRMPGMAIRVDAADAEGRWGVALVNRAGGSDVELLFAADTYAYLGMNRPDPGAAGPAGSRILVRQAVRHVAVVNSVGSVE